MGHLIIYMGWRWSHLRCWRWQGRQTIVSKGWGCRHHFNLPSFEPYPSIGGVKMENATPREPRYRFTGHERVLHDISATKALPELLSLFGYERVFLVCSRSINTKTPIIQERRECLGSRLVGLTDDV